MDEMMTRATEISKGIFSIEVTAPRLTSAPMTYIHYRSSEFELCDGHWTLFISILKDSICCHFNEADNVAKHFKGVVVRKSVQINGGDIDFDLPIKMLFLRGSIFDYEKSKFWWKVAGQKDSLKVTCVIACPQCQQKFKGKEFLPEWIIPMYEQLGMEIKKFYPTEEMKFLLPLGVQNTLKRKYPEDGEFSASKIKKLDHLSGADKLREDIKGLLSSGLDSDVVINVKDHEFRVHKNILRARSPVLFGMFSHDMAENNSGTVHITDCDPAAFQQFLSYLYSGELKNVSEDILFDLYYIGDKYGVEEMKKICVTFISKYLSVEMFCEILTWSLQHKESALLEAAKKFFVENLREITTTDHWISFLRGDPVTGNDLQIFAMLNAYNFK